ncbi:MAG: hypothetical protein IPJ58_17580 [Ardenticatenia bacterium]|nr:hypothetical protein [Ardenticatenia bacterium]
MEAVGIMNSSAASPRSYALGRSEPAMRGNYIILSIELDAIRDFLDHVDREAGADIESIFLRNDSGEFEDVDDFGNALYGPITRQEIAARAVYYELNGLIERELQRSAHLPWLESAKHRGPKSLDWNRLTADSVRSLRMIEDLPYREVVMLVEHAYDIRISDLDSGSTVLKMRETVNAFKHRDGFVDFRKQEPKDINFFERHKADVEQAYAAIDKARAFVVALWKLTDRAPSVPPGEATA